MEGKKHIILGAGGAITHALVQELLSHHEAVKLVSRRGFTLPGTESAKADLTGESEVGGVVEPSSLVYLLAGLPYNTAIWREQWPVVMRNAIAACKAHNASLIFFDNVYMYGRVHGPMKEDTPMNPCSRKGEIRAQIAALLLSEAAGGNLRALIARSADFYGPYARGSSVPMLLVLERLAKGNRPQWLSNAKALHSFTYTMDCGKALHLLSETEGAYGQVWHLPTASPPITGEEFISMAARQFGVEGKYTVMGKWLIRLGGVFDKLVRETYEMIYQSEHDYVFDSSKFERQFNFTPTPYEKGIAESVTFLRQGGRAK
jgi:nucleoside-diphosphate-sugar epimerase